MKQLYQVNPNHTCTVRTPDHSSWKVTNFIGNFYKCSEKHVISGWYDGRFRRKNETGCRFKIFNMPPTQFVLKFAYASNRCSCSYSTLVPTQAPSKLKKRRCWCVRCFQTVCPYGPSSEFDTPWLGYHSSPSPSHRPVSTLVMSHFLIIGYHGY